MFTFKMFGCVEADRVSLRATDYGVLLRLVSVSKKGPKNGQLVAIQLNTPRI